MIRAKIGVFYLEAKGEKSTKQIKERRTIKITVHNNIENKFF